MKLGVDIERLCSGVARKKCVMDCDYNSTQDIVQFVMKTCLLCGLEGVKISSLFSGAGSSSL